MATNKSEFIFNMIAPVYGLFYNYQKRRSVQVIEAAKDALDLLDYKTILDVGCGTGALCTVMSDMKLDVTGVDAAEKMLGEARRKAEGKPIRFLSGNVLGELPFEGKSFDVSIASYVAHGMGEEERQAMYREMSRVTRHKIVFYDYNQKTSFLTTFIERLEGGNYPNFIKNAETEMRRVFPEVEVVQVYKQSNWYICTPIERTGA
jgi:ubiquinone/menaquinone biosynthesis C-methylase UbiE